MWVGRSRAAWPTSPSSSRGRSPASIHTRPPIRGYTCAEPRHLPVVASMACVDTTRRAACCGACTARKLAAVLPAKPICCYRGGAVPKSRDLAKQETREALIQAGMDAFSEEGVDLPSLDAICARAGFTRGAFYVHFKDREDFFDAVVEKALQDFVDWVLSAGGTGGGSVGDVVDRFLDVVRDNKLPVNDRHRLLMQLVARGTKHDGGTQPYRALIEQAIARLTHAAEQGQSDGTVKRDLDPTQLGLLLVAASVGFIAVVEAGYAPDYEKIRAFMHALLRAPHG